MGLYGNYFSSLVTESATNVVNPSVVEEEFDILSFLNSPILEAMNETSKLLESAGASEELSTRYQVLSEFALKDIWDKVKKVFAMIIERIKRFVSVVKQKIGVSTFKSLHGSLEKFHKMYVEDLHANGSTKYDGRMKKLAEEPYIHFNYNKFYDFGKFKTESDAVVSGSKEVIAAISALLNDSDADNSTINGKIYENIEKLKAIKPVSIYDAKIDDMMKNKSFSEIVDTECKSHVAKFVNYVVRSDNTIDGEKWFREINNMLNVASNGWNEITDIANAIDKSSKTLKDMIFDTYNDLKDYEKVPILANAYKTITQFVLRCIKNSIEQAEGAAKIILRVCNIIYSILPEDAIVGFDNGISPVRTIELDWNKMY